LPAFVGALLGATTVRPGRVNAAGTIIAVLVLAVGIAGLQQLGNSFFVEPIFQGLALIISVGLAGYAARRRKA
jgi:ribose transport system permease protein